MRVWAPRVFASRDAIWHPIVATAPPMTASATSAFSSARQMVRALMAASAATTAPALRVAGQVHPPALKANGAHPRVAMTKGPANRDVTSRMIAPISEATSATLTTIPAWSASRPRIARLTAHLSQPAPRITSACLSVTRPALGMAARWQECSATRIRPYVWSASTHKTVMPTRRATPTDASPKGTDPCALPAPLTTNVATPKICA
jgi:hypothetical protein